MCMHYKSFIKPDQAYSSYKFHTEKSPDFTRLQACTQREPQFPTEMKHCWTPIK